MFYEKLQKKQITTFFLQKFKIYFVNTNLKKTQNTHVKMKEFAKRCQ